MRGEVVLQALANHDIRLGCVAQGNYRRAIEYCNRTVASLEGAGRHERFGQLVVPAVFSRVDFVWCHAERWTFAEDRALGKEALRTAEDVDHRGSLVFAYRGMGLLPLCQGELHHGRPRLERAVSLRQDADLPGYFPLIAASLCKAYTLSGRVANALSLLTQAMEQAVATDTFGFQVFCGLSLGETRRLTGRLGEVQILSEQARAELSIAIELYRIMDMAFWLPQAESALAEVEGR